MSWDFHSVSSQIISMYIVNFEKFLTVREFPQVSYCFLWDRVFEWNLPKDLLSIKCDCYEPLFYATFSWNACYRASLSYLRAMAQCAAISFLVLLILSSPKYISGQLVCVLCLSVLKTFRSLSNGTLYLIEKLLRLFVLGVDWFALSFCDLFSA